jgi:hypothetical protein
VHTPCRACDPMIMRALAAAGSARLGSTRARGPPAREHRRPAGSARSESSLFHVLVSFRLALELTACGPAKAVAEVVEYFL